MQMNWIRDKCPGLFRGGPDLYVYKTKALLVPGVPLARIIERSLRGTYNTEVMGHSFRDEVMGFENAKKICEWELKRIYLFLDE